MKRIDGRRIAVGGFMHETNTFQPVPTTYRDFAEAGDRQPLVRGDEVLRCFEGVNTSIAGAMEVFRDVGATLVPLTWASATPAGYVAMDAFERIAAMICEDLERALPLDGVYLSLHGAMVAEHVEDCEGELLARVRAVVGERVPVVASLDLHSNTTKRMFELSDGLVSYCTYPHVDMADTGRKAARLLAETIARGGPPAKAFHQIPYLIPLTWQCSTIEPSRSIYAEAERMLGESVASTSFTPGFPAADIADCGPAVFTYGWDAEAVTEAAQRLRQLTLDAESRYAGRLWAPDEAVREAMRLASADPRPVLLADTQDNPGVGGTSDTVGLLDALLRNGAERAVLGVLHDPEAAHAAHRAGEGASIELGIGAKSGAWGERPVERKWTVDRLGDGNTVGRGPVMGGWRIALGPTALLRCGGVAVVVASKRVQAMDQELFRHVGVEPRDCAIVALKSSVHFRGDFEPLAQQVLVVESPGTMIVDPSKLPFRRLRAGMRMRPLGPPFAGAR